ncbi:hypothetical protein IT407_01590 [Candidatus Uhrbacteria bacterium]|nr:hypothetical protein [Candidatus Uhrbacteria bacterium]
MSLSMSPRLEQRIEQTLKQELRQEIRLALEQLLRLIQTLKLGHKLDMKRLTQFQERVASLDQSDYRGFIHKLSNEGASSLRELADAFIGVGQRHEQLRGLTKFGSHLANRAESMEQESYKPDNFGIGLRMALCVRNTQEAPVPRGMYGTPENLEALLEMYPQSAPDGTLRWILAGGWAVELLTSVPLRDHHDIDTLLLTKRPRFLDTDQINSDDYFGVISCTDDFVVRYCCQGAPWTWNGMTYRLMVLRPEFLFCSKFLKPPREKDWDDVVELAKKFSKTWNLLLIRRLIDRNSCRFKRGKELLGILRSRDPETIIEKLRPFHTD